MKKTVLFLSFVFLLAGCMEAPSKFPKIKQTRQGGYQLIINGKPLFIKGVIYNPIPPGEDYSYNFWKDTEMIRKHAQKIKEGGYNAVRFYRPGDSLEETKEAVRILYEEFGIYSIMGHWMGFWNYPSPFYADEDFRQQVQVEVLEMVEALKDQEGILMWVLGNENNYSFSGKVNPWPCQECDNIDDPSKRLNKKAEVYYSLVNDITKAIKEVDPNHLVGLGNGELMTLDIASKFAKDIDLLALIFYRGKKFGNLFNGVKNMFDKPIVITELGCDAYDAYKGEETQDLQAEFLLAQWVHLYQNTTFSGNMSGNCLGGFIFEWNDEWWKYNPSLPSAWKDHNTEAGWSNGSYYFDIKAERNLNMNEEWFGLVAYEENETGGYIQKSRKAYYTLKEFFDNPEEFVNTK